MLEMDMTQMILNPLGNYRYKKQSKYKYKGVKKMKKSNSTEDKLFRDKGNPKWRVAENGDIYRFNKRLSKNYLKEKPEWEIKIFLDLGYDPDDFERA